jgi:hypothetical protein
MMDINFRILLSSLQKQILLLVPAYQWITIFFLSIGEIIEQFFRYIKEGTSYTLMRWWCLLCTAPLFSFQANQSFLLLLNATLLSREVTNTLIWHNQGSNPQSTTLERSMLYCPEILGFHLMKFCFLWINNL